MPANLWGQQGQEVHGCNRTYPATHTHLGGECNKHSHMHACMCTPCSLYVNTPSLQLPYSHRRQRPCMIVHALHDASAYCCHRHSREKLLKASASSCAQQSAVLLLSTAVSIREMNPGWASGLEPDLCRGEIQEGRHARGWSEAGVRVRGGLAGCRHKC
jgi:hypothetical protein